MFYGSTSAPNPILQQAARSAGIAQHIMQVPLPDLRVAVRAVKPRATAAAASRHHKAGAGQLGQLEGQQQQALQAGTAAPAAHHGDQAIPQRPAACGHVSKPAGQLASGVFAAGQVHVPQTLTMLSAGSLMLLHARLLTLMEPAAQHLSTNYAADGEGVARTARKAVPQWQICMACLPSAGHTLPVLPCVLPLRGLL